MDSKKNILFPRRVPKPVTGLTRTVSGSPNPLRDCDIDYEAIQEVPETPMRILLERSAKEKLRGELDYDKNHIPTGWNLQDVIDAHDLHRSYERHPWAQVVEMEDYTAEPARPSWDTRMELNEENVWGKYLISPPHLRCMPRKNYEESPLTPSPPKKKKRVECIDLTEIDEEDDTHHGSGSEVDPIVIE